jgi:CDP-diacylglycerol--glycerol-3-phosphate 3-phosphatidyltransferase
VPAAVLLGAAGLALGALLVLAAAFADGLDGAVAVLTGRATRLGYVVDSVADRLAELAWLTAFWLTGAPAWAVVTAGAASWLQEYTRARATAAGMTEIAVVTVSERPTRVLVTIFGLLLGSVFPWAPPAAVAVWIALTAVALTQLAVAVRRQLATD